jgi:hypothetical protein
MRFDFQANDLSSSNIKKIEYHCSESGPLSLSNKGTLYVTFHTGKRYLYHDVPFSVAVDLLASESIGSKFSKLFVNTYKFEALW